MDIYGLFSVGNNDMDYEDHVYWNDFIGIFTSVEEAKNYAEKKLNSIREDKSKRECWKYENEARVKCDPLTVVEDWHWDGDRYKKRVEYPEFGMYDDEYVIKKLTINQEFKEDKYYGTLQS